MKQDQSDDVGRFFPSRSFPRLALESDVGKGVVVLGWTDPSTTSEAASGRGAPVDKVSVGAARGAPPPWASEEPTVERAVAHAAVAAAREEAFRTVQMSNEQLLALLEGCRSDESRPADLSGEHDSVVDLPMAVSRPGRGEGAPDSPPPGPTQEAEAERSEPASLFVGDLTVAESPVALRARRAAMLSGGDPGRGEASTELAVLLVAQEGTENAPVQVVPTTQRDGGLDAALAQARSVDADASALHTRRGVDVEVDVARRVADPRLLGDALESLAQSGDLDALARGGLLVEAAYGALEAGEMATAVRRAREAARVAPDLASSRLLAQVIECRAGRSRTLEAARVSLAVLSKLGPELPREDRVRRAYLVASMSRLVHDHRRATELLDEACNELGRHPLLALGLARQYAAEGHYPEALASYDEALEGPLLGVHGAGEVAILASAVAAASGDLTRSMRYAKRAERDPSATGEAQARSRVLAAKLASLRRLGRGSAPEGVPPDRWSTIPPPVAS